MKICDDNKPLAAIVCGFEQGGTTLVSEILRQHPKLDSGFEGGFLLADNVADFLSIEPYCTNLKAGWQIQQYDIEYICSASTWAEVYARLLERSSVIQDKATWLFDKTPVYMKSLTDVLKKVPDVPCIAIVRDPRAILWSWAKRSKLETHEWVAKNIEHHCERYLSYAFGLQKAIQNGLDKQILLIQYELLCSNGVTEAKRIFDFLNLDFSGQYISFNQGARFPNVYGSDVSTKYLTEYKEHFSDETCEKILRLTKDCKDWFWEN